MNNPDMKCVIVGCARSGTGFLASLLSSAGLTCGHEHIFHPTTDSNNIDEFDFESSWFSAPHIDNIQNLTHIIHVVRDPRLVVDSLIRLGVFAHTPIHYITKGCPLKFFKSTLVRPRQSLERYLYVMDHRLFLKNNTSAFDVRNEAKRAEVYWREWNKLIEHKAKTSQAKYFMLRLEAITENPQLMFDCLGYAYPPPLRCIERPKVINQKISYRSRNAIYELDQETVTQARKYGLSACVAEVQPPKN